MNEGLFNVSGCDSDERVADIIFVHGLDGDARATWERGDQEDSFWPAWLGQEFPNCGVWSLGYAASSSAWRGNTMPLADRATQVIDLLELEGIGQRPVMFVCHSLGGLLVKQLLRLASDEKKPKWHAVLKSTKAVAYLSTPHSGSDMASWGILFRHVLRSTVTVEELKPHFPWLRDIDHWYRDNVPARAIETVVFFEKKKIRGFLIVDEGSANPGIPNVRPIPLDDDHISICKPRNKNAQVYLRIRQLVAECLVGTQPAAPAAAHVPLPENSDSPGPAGVIVSSASTTPTRRPQKIPGRAIVAKRVWFRRPVPLLSFFAVAVLILGYLGVTYFGDWLRPLPVLAIDPVLPALIPVQPDAKIKPEPPIIPDLKLSYMEFAQESFQQATATGHHWDAFCKRCLNHRVDWECEIVDLAPSSQKYWIRPIVARDEEDGPTSPAKNERQDSAQMPVDEEFDESLQTLRRSENQVTYHHVRLEGVITRLSTYGVGIENCRIIERLPSIVVRIREPQKAPLTN